MAFNNSNITKFLVLFLFVGFLLGFGFAVESCNVFDDTGKVLPTEGCTFTFNSSWYYNSVNNYGIGITDADFVFKLQNNYSIKVAVKNPGEFTIEMAKPNQDYYIYPDLVNLNVKIANDAQAAMFEGAKVLFFEVTSVEDEGGQAVVVMKPDADWLNVTISAGTSKDTETPPKSKSPSEDSSGGPNSCTTFANSIIPIWEPDEVNPNAPTLITACRFTFEGLNNGLTWNRVNGYKLDSVSNVDFRFNLSNNDSLTIGFNERAWEFGGYGKTPMEYVVKRNNSLIHDGILDLDTPGTYKVRDNDNKEILSLKVSKDSVKYYIDLTPNVVEGISNCQPITTFNSVDESCILKENLNQIVLSYTNPTTIINYSAAPDMSKAYQKNEEKPVKLVWKQDGIWGLCVDKTYLLEYNMGPMTLTAKNELCPKMAIKEGSCEDTTITKSFKCEYDQDDSFVSGNQNTYDTKGKQYTNKNMIMCSASNSYSKYYYKVIENNAFICDILNTETKASPSNYKCEDLESGSYGQDQGVLKIGVEASLDGWSVINVGKATSVYIKELDTYYRQNPKDKGAWQKCTKGTGTTTTTPKEGAKTEKKPKGNGVIVKKSWKGWADKYCKKTGKCK